MLSGIEVRDRVRNGLSTGKLWRLTRDQAKLHGAADGTLPCHVCERRIPWGQAYALERAAAQFVVHLECYVFWLHECGLFESEPRLCAACRRLIPPHAETATIAGEPYHGRCWDRVGASHEASLSRSR